MQIIQLIISIIVVICEFVFAGMIIYTRWIGDIDKTQAFFRKHKRLQITVFTMSIVGFVGIVVRIFMI